MSDKAKEYIKNESSAKSSIEKLMEKYAAVEEDDAIRQTWNNNADKRNTENKRKGNSKYTSYYYSPRELKNDTIPDVRPKMAESFENARSNFDSDSVLFSEIELSPVQEQAEKEKPTEKKTVEKTEAKEEKTAEKKTANKKTETEEKKPEEKKTTKKKNEEEEKQSATKKTTRKKKDFEEIKKEPEVSENAFQTNTRVVFEDKSVDDGIRRHTEDEISNAFLTGKNAKKRFFRRRDK